MGDPAGIGPEIVLKSLCDVDFSSICEVVIIGDRSVLESTAREIGIDAAIFKSKISPFILDLNNVSDHLASGYESAATGKASAEYIEKAVELWREKKIDAVATAPISKNAIALAGYSFPGHTEFLASLTNTKEFAMSFFAEKLRVVLLSTHVSLLKAIDLVKKEALVELISFSSKELSRVLHRPIKLAVAGLNPHASENGMFGDEEAREILPAVVECRENLGIDVSGPFSPDTIFLRGYRGEFDGVIACYHDQATIAVKSLSFGSSVNVTLGLPLIRTSVDHGTAFDIAGKGIAEASSMAAAIKLAAELARRETEGSGD
jgi:4-hydroxythreonine-4-phosphate dehydrogenase